VSLVLALFTKLNLHKQCITLPKSWAEMNAMFLGECDIAESDQYEVLVSLSYRRLHESAGGRVHLVCASGWDIGVGSGVRKLQTPSLSNEWPHLLGDRVDENWVAIHSSLRREAACVGI
jgi:hypothetical protein